MSGALSSAWDSLAALVQHFESGGNYGAVSATSTASGAYQFTNPTWQQYAGQLGITQYPTAASAPAAVQDQVFGQAVSQNGLGDWLCPNCDPGLSAAVAQNPSLTSLPTFSGGSSNPATSQGGTTANYGFDPSTGTYSIPLAPGDTSTESSTTSGATSPNVAGTGGLFNQFTTWLSSIASRAGLFVLAILFIIGALILFGIKSGIDIETSQS